MKILIKMKSLKLYSIYVYVYVYDIAFKCFNEPGYYSTPPKRYARKLGDIHCPPRSHDKCTRTPSKFT